MCLSCGMSLVCFKSGFGIIKQLLPLSEGDMMICSLSTGYTASGEQIIMSSSLKGSSCVVLPF